jgi:hypothetical protein
MRKAFCIAVMFSLILCGVSFAGDETAVQDTNTIVGADQLLNNRYQYIDPTDENTKLSQTTEKLLDQGVIQAAEQARTTHTAAPNTGN